MTKAKVSCSVSQMGSTVYAFGGKGDPDIYLDDIEVYQDQKWTLCSVKLAVPAYNIGAFNLDKDTLLLCGGIQQRHGISNQA